MLVLSYFVLFFPCIGAGARGWVVDTAGHGGWFPLVKNLRGSLRIFEDLQGSLKTCKDLQKIFEDEDLSRILKGSLKDL